MEAMEVRKGKNGFDPILKVKRSFNAREISIDKVR